MTGGCHWSWDCKGYVKECKNCPAITSIKLKNLAHRNFLEKNYYLNKINRFVDNPEAYEVLQTPVLD